MEILFWIIVVIIAIVIALLAFIQRYKTDANAHNRRMIKWYHCVGIVLFYTSVLCFGSVGFLYFGNDIGIPSTKIASNIRAYQSIDAEWVTEGMVADTMAAFISYSPDQSDHVFSVYVNRPGLSLGYFFRDGGTIESVKEGIAERTYDGYDERVFISMNTRNVALLRIDDGKGIQAISIDNKKPFAIVVPANAYSITFYDMHGNIVEFQGENLIN